MKNEESIMKTRKITEELFWKCESCGKENQLKMLFCDECGAECSDNHVYKNKCHKVEVLTKKTNIEPFDWFLMIVAFGFAIMFFFHVASTKSLEGWFNNIVTFSLINIGIIFLAFMRLILYRTIKLWQRFTVLGISAFLNPVVLLLSFMSVMIVFSEISTDVIKVRNKFISKKSLAKACSEIILQPNKYKSEYSKDFSELPDFIRELEPSFITIKKKCITIHKNKTFADYGWKFEENNNQKWNLYSYMHNESDLLLSDIIINTNNGEVTIPWHFF